MLHSLLERGAVKPTAVDESLSLDQLIDVRADETPSAIYLGECLGFGELLAQFDLIGLTEETTRPKSLHDRRGRDSDRLDRACKYYFVRHERSQVCVENTVGHGARTVNRPASARFGVYEKPRTLMFLPLGCTLNNVHVGAKMTRPAA